MAPVPSRRSAKRAPHGERTNGLSPGAREELELLHSVHSVSAREGFGVAVMSAAARGARATARREGSATGS